MIKLKPKSTMNVFWEDWLSKFNDDVKMNF